MKTFFCKTKDWTLRLIHSDPDLDRSTALVLSVKRHRYITTVVNVMWWLIGGDVVAHW